MFAHIRGTVDSVNFDRAVIEACGVGYELICPASTLKYLSSGESAKLLVHFHLSQDQVALYGFYTDDERVMFRRLIAVSRVGPKVALAVLSSLSVSDIAAAILTENAAAFDKVPGMGRKTAARVLLELKEKVESSEMLKGVPADGSENTANVRKEAVAALVALGYDGVSAGRAVAAVKDCARVEDMIPLALREITARKG